MDMKCMPAGNEAVVVEFGQIISEEINFRVHALAAFIRNRRISGIREVLPTFRSLMIFYDSNTITYRTILKEIRKFKKLTAENKEKEEKKVLLVPCCYGSAFGPDLKEMAAALNMSEQEIIQIHTQNNYKIYMIGFLPGFVYLGNLDERIHAPRLETPRTAIPARSVGIGGSQTGVYPLQSPGGWRLIGSTPLDFYNPKSPEPILCKAGEYIHFFSVNEKEYISIRKEVEAGLYQPAYLS